MARAVAVALVTAVAVEAARSVVVAATVTVLVAATVTVLVAAVRLVAVDLYVSGRMLGKPRFNVVVLSFRRRRPRPPEW